MGGSAIGAARRVDAPYIRETLACTIEYLLPWTNERRAETARRPFYGCRCAMMVGSTAAAAATTISTIPAILFVRKYAFEGSFVAFQLSKVFQHHRGAAALANPHKKTTA